MIFRLCPALLLLSLIANPAGHSVAQGEPAPETPEVIEIRKALILPRVGVGGRSPVHVDPIEAALIDGSFAAPKAGNECRTWQGEIVTWSELETDDEGWFESDDLRGGYLFASIESPESRIVRLNARGHSVVYVNGEPRGGDVYNYGYVGYPVALKRGVNEFLFLVGRGRMKASLTTLKDLSPEPVVRVNTRDATLPDLVAGSAGTYWASVPVENHHGVDVTVYVGPSATSVFGDDVAAITIPPMTSARATFRIEVSGNLEPGEHEMGVKVWSPSGGSIESGKLYEVTEAGLKIRVRGRDEPRRVTFVSRIDGSVQYYGLREARPLPGDEDAPGIVLTLHGASVEAIGQARAYRAKSWCHIVAPTNRRPFGFDWEDWGRVDAMEVLEHAQATLENDPTKVWLTGHSMGGHGAWSVGSHFPDRFAAIGPSAGWESFWSYTGGGGHPDKYSVSALLNRTANPSRTLLRKYNYKPQGVYILHGDADDNVPVRESRRMHEELEEFHTDVTYFEQPGAGHWWDDGHDEGTDCVDWQPMFDAFARRRLPNANEVMHIDFTTVCPEHNSQCHWLWVQTQSEQLSPSRVQMRADPVKRRFVGTTENVSRLGIHVSAIMAPAETLVLQIDGQELNEVPWPKGGRLYLTIEGGEWTCRGEGWDAYEKGPHRYGWFKNAYANEFVYVYGTSGAPAETAANYNKARYDLETWSYRANGSFEVIADRVFDPEAYVDRNVILVGNADNNSAWDKVLGDCPVRIENGSATIGDRTAEGDDLALLFIYPRAGSDAASVGVIGGTGAKGVMLTRRIRTFVSGASYPDFILYGPEMLHEGTGGVRAAGYFDVNWTLDEGEVVWNKINQE